MNVDRVFFSISYKIEFSTIIIFLRCKTYNIIIKKKRKRNFTSRGVCSNCIRPKITSHTHRYIHSWGKKLFINPSPPYSDCVTLSIQEKNKNFFSIHSIHKSIQFSNDVTALTTTHKF